jgi:WD40 repeat protein
MAQLFDSDGSKSKNMDLSGLSPTVVARNLGTVTGIHVEDCFLAFGTTAATGDAYVYDLIKLQSQPQKAVIATIPSPFNKFNAHRVLLVAKKKLLFVAYTNNVIILYNFENGQKIETLRGHTDIVDNMVICPCVEGSEKPDEILLASSSNGKKHNDYAVNLWKINLKSLGKTQSIAPWSKFTSHTKSISSLVATTAFITKLDKEVRLVISGSSDGTLHCNIIGEQSSIHNTDTSVGLLNEGVERVSGVQTGRNVVKIQEEKKVQPTQKEEKQHVDTSLLYELHGHSSTVSVLRVGQLELNDDLDDVVISGSYDGTVRVWNLTNGGKCMNILQGHKGGIESLYFNDRDCRIITTSSDCTGRVWDLETCRCELSGFHSSFITCQAISNKYKLIFTGGHEGKIGIWSTTGQLLGSLDRHTGAIRHLFVFQNTMLISASDDGTIRTTLFTFESPQE